MDPNTDTQTSGAATGTAKETTVTDNKPWIAKNENDHVLTGTGQVAPGYTKLTDPAEIRGYLDNFSGVELKNFLVEILTKAG